jgi:hypothetical protein
LLHDKLINNVKVKEKVCPASPHCGKEISPQSLLLAYALKFVLWPKVGVRCNNELLHI